MIRFEQVGKRYPNGHVGLHELSFGVRRGEFLFVTGHSGAGKSTLLRLLDGRLEPDSGRVKRGKTVRLAVLDQQFTQLEQIAQDRVREVLARTWLTSRLVRRSAAISGS